MNSDDSLNVSLLSLFSIIRSACFVQLCYFEEVNVSFY